MTRADMDRVEEAAQVLRLETTPGTRLWIDAAGQDRANAELPADQSVLALSPAASAVFKEWSPERFSELALRLTAEDGLLPGAVIAIFGGPGDVETAEVITESLPEDHRTNLAGQTTLAELTASTSLFGTTIAILNAR